MEVIRSFALSNYLFQFVVLIIITGILISEFIRRSERRGILLYIVNFVLIIIVNIFDTYYNFTGVSKNFLVSAAGALTIASLGVFALNSVRVWKFVNKVLFLLIFIFVLGISVLRIIFSISIESNYEILVIILFICATISNYFFIMNFLIKSSGKKMRRKK